MKRLLYLSVLLLAGVAQAQKSGYWQQKADYTMEIDMDVQTYRFNGTQKIVYTNNSPDELREVFYHLQFNAFQPGSEMDIRLQQVADPDPRMVENRGTRDNPIYQSLIAELKPDEIGYQKVLSLKQDGRDVSYDIFGSIMKVNLNKPIKAGSKTTFEMVFQGQVPLQIRRSGRNNKEGVALSMTQWYPKLAEYDFEGWHANAYLAREFHGVWGDFDVTIHIDKDYTIGGTGYLQNPQQVGHGYEDPSKPLKRPTGDKLTWHFKAPDVHDFTWAADPNYVHDQVIGENGVRLHFFYKDDPKIKENWSKLQAKTQDMLRYFNKHLGTYPYEQYSVIQGGDGGMEYAMCTLITGERSFASLVGVTAHEFAHSWFQFVLATNETKHPWMDEGFTDYISDHCMNEVMDQGKEFPTEGSYKSYYRMANYYDQEPLSTYSDRYESNTVYTVSSYSKGSVFLSQLGYVIGEENLARTLKNYYEEYKFRHPTPNDFIRVAEKVSGIQLAWYLNYWTQTTRVIDYAVTVKGKNKIELQRIGGMPMPIDLRVTYSDGSQEDLYIPLNMMYGSKKTKAKVLGSWSWVNPRYSLETGKEIREVQIDPSKRMADINQDNNIVNR